MLTWLIVFVIVAVIAAGLGFTGIAAGAATLARIIFGLMLIGIVLMLALTLFGVLTFA